MSQERRTQVRLPACAACDQPPCARAAGGSAAVVFPAGGGRCRRAWPRLTRHLRLGTVGAVVAGTHRWSTPRVLAVELKRTSGFFRGFIMSSCNNAACSSSSQRKGSFTSTPSLTKYISCGGSSASVTHSNSGKSTFTSKTFNWVAPATGTGAITFKATCVEDRSHNFYRITKGLTEASTLWLCCGACITALTPST